VTGVERGSGRPKIGLWIATALVVGNMIGSGGPYAYTRRGVGDMAAFLVAWGYWISIWAGNAAISVAFVGYMADFFPALAETPAYGAGAALAAIWLLTGVSAIGVREGASSSSSPLSSSSFPSWP